MPLFAWFRSLFGAATRFPHSEYFPLETGLKWSYDVKTRWPDGKTTSFVLHKEIKGTRQRGKRTYFLIAAWEVGPLHRHGSKELVRKDKTGLYCATPGIGRNEEECELVFPLVVGHTWSQRSTSRVKTQVTVVSQETVTIGENTYPSCFRVRFDRHDIQSVTDSWLAPGHGPVKTDVRYSTGRTVQSTLREFRSKKK